MIVDPSEIRKSTKEAVVPTQIETALREIWQQLPKTQGADAQLCSPEARQALVSLGALVELRNEAGQAVGYVKAVPEGPCADWVEQENRSTLSDLEAAYKTLDDLEATFETLDDLEQEKH